MNSHSFHSPGGAQSADATPILVIPYQWVGDFVRCHSVVKLLRARWPDRPVDVLTNSLCAPLVDYMPGVRKGIVWDLPRKRLPFRQYNRLAERLGVENYGSALILPRTWKSALAPYLAGIPERTGFVGEARFVLINDLRFRERKLPRMIDRSAALALPKNAALPQEWPLPELAVPDSDVLHWQTSRDLARGAAPIVMLAPGAIGPGKQWPLEHYADVARALADGGATVCVLGGPRERPLAAEIISHAGDHIRDLTDTDMREAVLALKAADLAIANDSGLLHVAAAAGTPTIGIFGPTDPALWGPLNPLAAIVEPDGSVPCPTCGTIGCRKAGHRSTSEISAARVIDIARQRLQGPALRQ
jgi:heptosyltransferase-2